MLVVLHRTQRNFVNKALRYRPAARGVTQFVSAFRLCNNRCNRGCLCAMARDDVNTTSTPNSSLVVLIWLIVQLVASAAMSGLAVFHFTRTRPTSSSCWAVANLSAENDPNSTIVSEGPSWELSAVSMSLILVSLIITIVDATFNMHDLVHQVLDRGDAGAEQECKTDAKQPPYHFLPAGLFRVYYCWTLIHIILITVAANTKKWSWQTNDINVLSHTTVFFLTCIIYLLLVVAIFTRYGFIWTKHKPPQLVSILITGLVVSHISCTLTTLVVLFSNESDLDCLGHVAVGLPVAVYVFLSSSLWLLSNCLAEQGNSNHRYAAGITTILLIVLSVGALIACVSSLQLSINPLKRLSLLLFSLTLIPWLVLLCFLMHTASTCMSSAALSSSAENTTDGNEAVKRCDTSVKETSV